MNETTKHLQLEVLRQFLFTVLGWPFVVVDADPLRQQLKSLWRLAFGTELEICIGLQRAPVDPDTKGKGRGPPTGKGGKKGKKGKGKEKGKG